LWLAVVVVVEKSAAVAGLVVLEQELARL